MTEVSVLIPTFRRPDSFVRAVRSVFAQRDVTLGDTGDWAAQGIRDVPHRGEHIEAPNPVCTLLAEADTPAACLRKLRAMADGVRGWLVECA